MHIPHIRAIDTRADKTSWRLLMSRAEILIACLQVVPKMDPLYMTIKFCSPFPGSVNKRHGEQVEVVGLQAKCLITNRRCHTNRFTMTPHFSNGGKCILPLMFITCFSDLYDISYRAHLSSVNQEFVASWSSSKADLNRSQNQSLVIELTFPLLYSLQHILSNG